MFSGVIARKPTDQLLHLVSSCAEFSGRVRMTVGDEQIQYLAVEIGELFDAPQSLRQGQSHFWNVAGGTVRHEMPAPK